MKTTKVLNVLKTISTSLVAMAAMVNQPAFGQSGSWSTKSSMPFVSADAAGAVVGDVFYAICQNQPHLGEPSRLLAYDPATDSWVSKSAMLVQRHTVAVGVGDDKIYIAGGWDGGSDRGELEVYDPTSDTWTLKTSMPMPVRWPAGAVLNGVFYVTGGAITYPQPAITLNTVFAYNLVTDTWSTRVPMPTARAAHGVAAINGILYAVGGSSAADERFSTLEAYDPVIDAWTTKAPMPTARNQISVTVLNGLLYVAGGTDASGYLATVEVYDPATDCWATVPSMPTARGNPALGALGGKIYAAGGYDPTSGSLSVLEAFTPGTEAPLNFVGFLAPIGGADSSGGSFASPLRTFKMGSTIPVKFTASSAGSPVLTGVHTLQAIKYSNATTFGAPIDATPQGAATPGNQFRLTADEQWQFNLDTKGSGMSAGIWLLVATLSDGSEHSAWIQIK